MISLICIYFMICLHKCSMCLSGFIINVLNVSIRLISGFSTFSKVIRALLFNNDTLFRMFFKVKIVYSVI